MDSNGAMAWILLFSTARDTVEIHWEVDFFGLFVVNDPTRGRLQGNNIDLKHLFYYHVSLLCFNYQVSLQIAFESVRNSMIH